jgi:hypothetical protein
MKRHSQVDLGHHILSQKLAAITHFTRLWQLKTQDDPNSAALILAQQMRQACGAPREGLTLHLGVEPP